MEGLLISTPLSEAGSTFLKCILFYDLAHRQSCLLACSVSLLHLCDHVSLLGRLSRMSVLSKTPRTFPNGTTPELSLASYTRWCHVAISGLAQYNHAGAPSRQAWHTLVACGFGLVCLARHALCASTATAMKTYMGLDLYGEGSVSILMINAIHP